MIGLPCIEETMTTC